ncbi:uncharacterized protein LOC6549582 [Drosophila erecta]|uniref:CCDC113/CCDC96 coiled-coil domain-containing protein n=1 Tax=Drosophila erecta TaxID=7220 RepID=B3NLF1_DROER|nr:uncharacterized protein LOC6549582 [Drosophila erecta]EDV54867.2 uncharacterized protein Dere_GG21756 [Drosophila erecta]
MSIIQRSSLLSQGAEYSTDFEPTSRIGSTIQSKEVPEETLVPTENDKDLTKELVRQQKRTKAKGTSKTLAANKPRKVAKKPQKEVSSQAILRPIERKENTLASSKETSRRLSQKFSFRDGFSRNYLFDSPANRSSAMSTESNTSVLSRTSTSSRRSRGRGSRNRPPMNKAGLWGRYKIYVLKPKKPKVAEIVQETQTDSYNVQIRIVESIESLPSIHHHQHNISDSDSKKALTSIPSDSNTETESTLSEYESDLNEPDNEEQSERLKFLEIFGSLPDIDNLSATESAANIELTKEKERTKKRKEKELSAAVKKEEDHRESDSFVDLQVDESTENLDHKTHSIEISSESVSEADEQVYNEIEPKERPHKDISEHLFSLRISSTVFDDSSSGSFNEIHMATVAMVEQFLTGLINEVVEHEERTSVRLRRQLDKEKMLDELSQLVIDYQYEIQRNQALERIATDYYVRRKEFSMVSEDKQIDTINRERLMSALVELDNRLEQIKLTQKLSVKQRSELFEEEAAARAQDAQILAKFEAVVRETLCREGFDRVTIVVNELLKKMNKTRDETSDVRVELLYVQHRLQALKFKLEKLENLGNGLRVLEYISNHAGNNALRLKNKEKDIELKRFRDRKTYDLHAMAHLKNKMKMNEDLLENMKSKLNTQLQLKKDLRARHYREMVKHEWVKKKILKLKKAGCLMHYPDLLLDYDATVDHVSSKRLVVSKLRLEHIRLEEKISEVDTHIQVLKSSLRAKLSLASVSLNRLSNKSLFRIRR